MIMTYKSKYGHVDLYVQYGYQKATPQQKKKICNGAGPRNFGWIVPDTVWGLRITQAANIHDWMYHHGKTIQDKQRADRVFKNNMQRLIDAKKNQWRWVKDLRYSRAAKYYWAVDNFGGTSFWANKNNMPKTNRKKFGPKKRANVG